MISSMSSLVVHDRNTSYFWNAVESMRSLFFISASNASGLRVSSAFSSSLDLRTSRKNSEATA